MDFSQRTVLVTGGTGALGRIVVERFAGGGANVVVAYRNENELPQSVNAPMKNIYLIRADVTVEEEVVRLFASAQSKFAACSILINLVGGYLPSASVSRISLSDWDKMMTINLRSAFLCSREFLRQNAGAQYGRILNVGAMAALQPTAGRAPYAISKAGVIMLTEILGQETRGSGLTVNAIAPSIIDTPANRASMPDADYSAWVSPHDIAEYLMFLCSDDARSINGTTLPMTGGVKI